MERMLISECQKRLAKVWVGCVLFIVGLFFAQTMAGKFGDHSKEAWGWLLPTVMPSLSLIVGAVVADKYRGLSKRTTADRFAYRLSLGLSWFYLLLILCSILLQPLSPFGPLEMFSLSQFWLSPVHALVGIALGVFFTSTRD